MSPAASRPIAPALRTGAPSLASTSAVPPADPAAVMRISSTSSPPWPSGIASTGRTSTSSTCTPIAERPHLVAHRSSSTLRVRAVAARQRRRHHRLALLGAEHARLAERGRSPVDRAGPLEQQRAARAPRPTSLAVDDRAVVRHQRRAAALERVAAPSAPARACRRSRTGATGTAPPSCEHPVVHARQLVEHARERGGHRRVRVHDRAGVVARGRRRGAGRARTSARARRRRAPRPGRRRVTCSGSSSASTAPVGRDRHLVAAPGAHVARRCRARAPRRPAAGSRPPPAPVPRSRITAASYADATGALAGPLRGRVRAPMDTPRSQPARAARGGRVAGAGACAAGAPDAEAARRRGADGCSRHADVVVIGAGFAGLTAARELARDDRSVVRARGPQPRRRARAEQADRRRRGVRARRHVRGPTQNHILATRPPSSASARSRPSTRARTSTSPTASG